MLSAVQAGSVWSGARLPRAALAATALWVALYLWPLADGTSPEAFVFADRFLRLLATAVASGAALLAALRSPSGRRWPWACLAVAANIWATAQAVSWGYDLAGPVRVPPGVPDVGFVLFSLAAVALLATLLVPSLTRLCPRQVLDGFLLLLPVVLISWATGLGPVTRLAADSDAWTTALLVARLLVAVALVCTAAAVLARRARAEPFLLALCGGLVVLAVIDTGVVALAARDSPPAGRVVGLLMCAALTLVALGAVGSCAPWRRSPNELPVPADPPAPSALPIVLPALAGLVVLGTLLVGEPLDALEVAFLLTLLVLTPLRQHLVLQEASRSLREVALQEAEMRHLAFHDELTGLANRALFLDRLEHALELHRRYRRPLVVLFCDLDDFKAVNDGYGHVAGDEVLRAVASRLATTLRPADTFARLGGDEFAVLLEEDTDATAVARRMRTALEIPFRVGPDSIRIGMTIGTARVEAMEATPDAAVLLDRADTDMYDAKRTARGRRLIPAQDPAPPGAGLQAPSAVPGVPAGPVPVSLEFMSEAFARDVRAGRVDVVYQPLVDPATGAVRGLEALARWSYGGSPVLPGTFLPLAERAGAMGVLTDLVLDRACAQVRAWSLALGHERLTVSVNVAVEQMLDRDFPGRVRAAMERHGVARDQLVLEMTAAALAQDATTTYAVARLLREAGALLSLGSFTTDPVAFGHLQRMPLDSIKVDGDGPGVMVDLGGDERLMRAFQGLARELDLHVVVEGVERTEQLTLVRRVGGLLAQGYLLARPAPAAQLDEMVLHGLVLPD